MVMRKCVGFGLATVGGIALIGSVFGSDLRVYSATGERILSEKLDKACGVGAKLEVLKTRVQELDRECSQLRAAAVQRQVELEGTRSRVAEREAAIERQRKVLGRAAELLDEGRTTYEIAGRRYDRTTVEEDARAKLEACQANERSLETEQKLLAIQERTVEIAKAHLERAQKRRVELGQLVKSLEARVQQQKAKRALADALDQTPLSEELQGELAKAEKLAKEVQDKLQVEDRVLDERLAKKDVAAGQIDYDAQAKGKVEAEELARAIRRHLAPRKAAPAAQPAEAPAAPVNGTAVH